MSTSLLYHAFGCRDYSYKSTKYENGAVVFGVEPKKKLLRCGHCGSREIIRKGKRHRRIQSMPIGRRRVWLDVTIPRLQCKACSKLSEVFPPLPNATEAIPKVLQDMLSNSAD